VSHWSLQLTQLSDGLENNRTATGCERWISTRDCLPSCNCRRHKQMHWLDCISECPEERGFDNIVVGAPLNNYGPASRWIRLHRAGISNGTAPTWLAVYHAVTKTN